MKDLTLTRRIEFVPAGAIGERRRAKNRSCTLDLQFGFGIAGTFCVPLLPFATELFQIDRVKTFDAERGAVVEYLFKES